MASRRYACARAGRAAEAHASTRSRRRKGGATAWLLAQRARDAPPQKVHCIYKSFIMNYTMVYLKWEACLVRGYMGYRDYNACGGEKPGLQRPGIRATGRYRVGVLACVLTTNTRQPRSADRPRHACTRLQIGSASVPTTG